MRMGPWAIGTAVAAGLVPSGCSTPSPQFQPASLPRGLSTAWVPIPDNPAIGTYADVGNVELKIRDFYPCKLTRDVSIQPKGGRKTLQQKQNLGEGKTLWDIDPRALCTGGARQKVKAGVVINSDKDVYFQTVMIGDRPSSPIGAADSASAAAFADATLRVETAPRVWTAGFWLLCEASPASRLSKFNVALEVRDSIEAGYGLPLIVDPMIRNRG